MPGFTFFATAVAILVLVVALLRACARLDTERTVLLHVPPRVAWEFVRHYPALHAAHGRNRAQVAFDEYRLKRGDGETVGSTWTARGRGRGAPCWAEIELMTYEPGSEIAVRLVRDSFGTHRGLRHHRASLTLEESGPGATKLTSRLRARLLRPGLWTARLLAVERLQARLLDIGLRSIKADVEAARVGLAAAAPQAEPGSGRTIEPVAAQPAPPAAGRAEPLSLPPSSPPGGPARREK